MVVNVNTPQTASVTAENTFTSLQKFAGVFPLRIRGTWVATVTLQRSDDGGTTWDDITDWTANTVVEVKEPSGGADWRVGVKSGDFTSGTVELQLG